MICLKKLVSALFTVGALFLCTFLAAKTALATPADDWTAKGYPVADWTTDNFTYHQVGFVNDPQTKSFKLLVDMNPQTEKNKNGYHGNYNQLQPAGYTIKIGNQVYDLNLAVNPWAIQNGQTKQGDIGVWDEHHGQYKTSHNKVTYYADDKGHQSALVTIPYAMFSQEDIDAASTVSISNSNLGGQQKITLSGASTGPWLLAASAVLIAAPTVAIASRKKRASEP